MDDTEKRIKHLEFIENTIARMNSNSMQLKTWCVALISAFVALSVERKFSYGYLLCFPVIVFWFLDAKYLWLEKKYRKLYDKVKDELNGKQEKIDLFEMNIKKMGKENVCFCSVLFSWSESLFYIAMIIFCVFAYLIGGKCNA